MVEPVASAAKVESGGMLYAVSMWPYSDRQFKANVTKAGDTVDSDAKKLSFCSRKTLLSLRLWFVILAAAQMIAAVVLQINIYFNGGDGGILTQYRNCVSDNLSMAIECNMKMKLINISIPSFGKDKPVYIAVIIALTVYNTLLCFYALFGKHFLEIISFLIVNVLTMMYAAFEAWLFRPIGPKCTLLPEAAKYALGTMGILFAFTVAFVPMTFYIYRDFGWKIYKHVDCNHQMRVYYQWYEAVSSGVKLVILFTIVFSMGQLTLLLKSGDPEYVLTIVLVVVAVVAYFIVQLSIHYNSFSGHALIAGIGFLLFIYYVFKIERFATASCPTCNEQKTNLQREYMNLQSLFINCTGENLTVSSSEINRSIQFQSLALFAGVNLITVLLVFIIFIGFWLHQPGKKVMEHFQKHPSVIVQVMCYRQGEDSLYNQIKKTLGIKNKSYADYDLDDTDN